MAMRRVPYMNGACRLLISPTSSHSERQLLSIAYRGLITSSSSKLNGSSTVQVIDDKYKPLLLVDFARSQYTAAQPRSNQEHHDDHETVPIEMKESIRTTTQQETITHTGKPPQRDPLDLSFNDTKNAYKSKKTSELVRAFMVLKLSSYNVLVQNYKPLIKISRMILGQKLFHALMKATFYGHFVAGEDAEKIRPTIDHLRSFGVKSILDYSAEEDLSEEEASKDFKKIKKKPDQAGAVAQFQPHEKFADRRKFSPVARTYFYKGEAACERRMEIFLDCIDAVATRTSSTGLAAIKLTALVRPQILLQLSEAWYKNRTTRLDDIVPQAIRTPEEHEMYQNLMRRVREIVREGKENQVRVMIDAEQTYFQPAINLITMQMMREFNKEKAIVFNTYQCYLKSAYDTVCADIDLAHKEDFYFGAKLVRGAYMEQERERAKVIGYKDPINPDYEATSRMYHKTLEHLMTLIAETGPSNKRYAIMVASHNEDTVRFAVEKMKELRIQPDHRVICFGQLYGMCDHISFPLGQSGYSVYKYVPYGEIDEVLPYLCRRAIENNGVLTKVARERKLLATEIMRRFISGQIFMKPQGTYQPV